MERHFDQELQGLKDALLAMGGRAEGVVQKSVESLKRRDAAAARRVVARDDEVDNLNRQLFRELVSFMIEDARTITRAMELVLVARNLERVADLATNIAEDVVFVVEGKTIKHHAEG